MKKLLYLSTLILITLCFSGCFWGRGWLMPYAFQSSFKEFKEICQLSPEIYQANGGKLDEEYYNKVLAYFDTNINELDWNDKNNLRTNDRGILVYRLEKYFEDGRIRFSIGFYFKDKNAKKSSIDKIGFYAHWDNLRASLAGNEGTGFFWSGGWETCSYFKRRHKGLKGLRNGTYILKEDIKD